MISCNTGNTNVANEPQTILGKLRSAKPKKTATKNKGKTEYHPGAIQKLTRQLSQNTNKLDNSKPK